MAKKDKQRSTKHTHKTKDYLICCFLLMLVTGPVVITIGEKLFVISMCINIYIHWNFCLSERIEQDFCLSERIEQDFCLSERIEQDFCLFWVKDVFKRNLHQYWFLVDSVLLIFLVFWVFLGLFVFVLCLVYPMLPMSLDCPFFIDTAVFSNVYLFYDLCPMLAVSLDYPFLIAPSVLTFI